LLQVPIPNHPKITLTLRYPFIACELFGCNNLDVIKIFYGSSKDTISPNPKYLERLFSIIHNPAPIENLTSGYFCRTVSTLLQYTPKEFLTWFFSDLRNVKSIIANHLSEFSIGCILIKILSIDKELTKTDLLDGTFTEGRLGILRDLFGALEGSKDPEVWGAVFVVFKNIISTLNNTCDSTEIYTALTSYDNLN
jgi:hypothetical protein